MSIEEFLDSVTQCLKDDSEVRLDVRTELRTHLEERIAEFEAEGHPTPDAVNLTLDSFGPLAEVAESLLVANARRMKLRALARLGIRVGLMPSALILATWVCVSMANRSLPSIGPVNLQSELLEPFLDDLDDQEQFLFIGDTSRPRFAMQQRAIWEASPERIEYLDNYLTHLADDQISNGVFTPDQLIAEFEHAKALDPDNARYNYLLAGLLIDSSTRTWFVQEHHVPADAAEAGGASVVYGWTCGGRSRYALAIRDRETLNRAIAELLEGAEKPHFRRYASELTHERIAQLPRAATAEDQIARVRLSTAMPIPEAVLGDEIWKGVARYAALASNEGNAALAERLLQSWYRYATKMAEDGETVAEIGSIPFLAGQAELDLAPVFASMGLEDRADATRRLARRVRAPVIERESLVSSDEAVSLKGSLVQHGGMWALAFIPYPYHPPGISLQGIRSLSQIVLERIGLFGIALTLGVVLLGAALITLRWKFVRTGEGPPILMLPSPAQFARSVGYSILIPLFVYVAYTRWTTFSGREYTVTFMGMRFAIELALLGATIVFLSLYQTSRYVRVRCEALDIPTPAGASKLFLGFCGFIAAITATFCIAMNYWTGEKANIATMFGQWGVAIGFFCAVALVLALWFTRFLTGARSFGQYYGTVARSSMPILAAGLVVLCGLVDPYLANAETRLIHSTPHIAFDADLPGITELEVAGVQPLKYAIYEALAGEESETLVETIMWAQTER
jgi:hypothetical protein